MYFTYILTNKSNRVLYTGFTDDLKLRIFQHRNKLVKNSFTFRYNINKLVWYREFDNSNEAFQFERRVKKWKRSWKIELIEEHNPKWKDLAMEWDFSEYLA